MNKISLSVFFWIGYFLLCLSDMFLSVKIIYEYNFYIELFGLIIILFFIVCKILFKSKIEKSKMYIIYLLFLISTISYLHTKNLTILRLLFLCLAITDFEFDDFLKVDIKIKSMLYLILIILYVFGFTKISIVLRSNGSIRKTFGFIHPNALGLYTMMIIVELIYLFRNSKKLYLFSFLCFGVATFLKFTADSRAAVIVLNLFGILILFCHLWRKKKIYMITSLLLKNSFLIATFLSLYIVYEYENCSNFAIQLNKILSNRIKYASYYINKYNYNWFGNFFQNENIALDNAYIEIIIRFGILSFFIMYYFNYKNFEFAINKNNNILIIILFLLILYGLMENSILRVNYNVFLLMIFSKSNFFYLSRKIII